MGPITQEAKDELAWEEDWREERSLPCPPCAWSRSSLELNKYDLNKQTGRGRTLARRQGHRNQSLPDLHVMLAWVDTMRFYFFLFLFYLIFYNEILKKGADL